MDKGKSLLPWILGGLSMATAAIAIASAPTSAPASAPTPASPAPAPTLRVAQIRPVTPPTARNIEPSHQVWECRINGQRTFSDNPCGDKPSIREIGPVNGMDPTPILPHSRVYAPASNGQSGYDPSEQADSYFNDQQSADNSYPSDSGYPADNSYPVFIGTPFDDRRRRDHDGRRRPDPEARGGPDHEHQPYSHDRGRLELRSGRLQPGRN
jgi:hypothetical protein